MKKTKAVKTPTNKTVCQIQPKACWYETGENNNWILTLTSDDNAPFESKSEVVVKIQVGIERLLELQQVIEEAIHYAGR